ncbi:MAG: hypothetical protein IPO81_19595 [Kouleothrix sp.]|nr:hypothetical protein [Kouleothrix sp.]
MRRWVHLVCAGALALALLSSLAPPGSSAQAATAPPASGAGQSQDVRVGDDGSLTLAANAPPAPPVYGTFQHFGLAISSAQQFSTPFRSIRIDYDASAPRGSAVRLDVRASADGARWGAWQVGLAGGATATFASPARFAQYRATLLGSARGLPSIRDIRLAPQPGPAIYSALEDSQPVAPTWRLHATREGLVGHRTANGHRIAKRDRFVSLPSWRALAPDGTNDYMVRITYNGRSAVAPVYDVGPWNAHDDYWDEQRERFGDLPRGWPEDHAAYFDGYNGGRAEKGKVRFPTAIDVGDGVWWDDLGIKGDRAVVEVTFLWLGRDPLADQPPAPAPAPPPVAEAAPAPPPPAELVVDDGGAGFTGQAKVKWYDGSKGCGGAGHALWTYTTANPAESENAGRWQPALPAEAMYDVYAAIPACAARKPNTGSARYLVQHRDGTQEVVIDQAAGAGTWVLLGRFPFRAGDGGFVELRDVAGDEMRAIWYDSVKWVPAL